MKKVTVIKKFRDKIDHKTVYTPGQFITNLEKFDDKRLQDLSDKNMVAVEEIQTVFGVIDLDKSTEEIKKDLVNVDDIEDVTSALEAEGMVKNRAGVKSLLIEKKVELKKVEDALIEAISNLDDVEELKESLNVESTKEKPNIRIIEAIKNRIVELA